MAHGLAFVKTLGLVACLVAAGLAGCASSPTTRLSDLSSLQQRADAAYAHHDWQGAAAAYQALVRGVPANAAYWFRLGNCYARLDQPEPAVAAYRAALQRDPAIVPAWHNLGAVLLQQSQAAFREAAAQAKPADPLRHTSALLAERLGAVRAGASTGIPQVVHPPVVQGQSFAPVPAMTAGAAQKSLAVPTPSTRRRGARDVAPVQSMAPQTAAPSVPVVTPAPSSSAPVITPLSSASTGAGGNP